MEQHNNLSSSASRVQKALAQKGLLFEVKELSQSTRTAQEAALTIGCNIGQIVKSLLFKTFSNQPVLILVSGQNRVNEKSIINYVGEKIIKADAEFTREITGYAIGGIPPLGHQNEIKHIFIDEDLLCFEILWAAAGTPFAVFSLLSKDIQKISSGKIISIK